VLAAAISSSTVDARACERGLRKGQREVNRMWRNQFDEDCDEIIDLGRKVNRMVRRRFRETRRDNWWRREIKRCAKIGAADMLQKYEKKCFEDDSILCDALAEAAAESIVFENVCVPETEDSAEASYDMGRKPIRASRPDYKKSCRNVAIESCPGLIKPKIRRHCRGRDRNVKTSQLRALQELCEDAVIYLL